MRKLSTYFTLLMLVLFLSVQVPFTQEPQPGDEIRTETVKEFDQDEADSLIQAIRDFFDELLDVEIGWAALQARHISNVGYGLDNSIGLNRELRDTLELVRDVVQSELFVKSMLKYDHFWPNLINRKKYSPTVNELEKQNENLYDKDIYFDIIFYPAWDTNAMDPDAAREAGKIAYICQIKVNGLGEFSADLSEEEMATALNQLLEGEEYTRIKRDAAPDVNQGMFAGLGWLVEKFGFEPLTDTVNINTVNFFAPSKPEFGFDAMQTQLLSNSYNKVSIRGKLYTVPWKSMALSESDTLIAVIRRKDYTKPVGYPVSFATSNGVAITSVTQINDTTYKLALPPAGATGETALLASYTFTDSSGNDVPVIVGQADITTYAVKQMNVVIVPVNNNGSDIQVAPIEKGLNEIYKQAATSWRVVKYNGNLQVNSVYADDQLLNDGSTGLLSNYTDEMNTIIDAFEDQPGVDIDKNSCYLFLADRPKGGTSKYGYMPLKRNFGFIFIDNCKDQVTRTMAHELGHGPFRLFHTFSSENEYPQPKGSTNNLMDYGVGVSLYKYQWDLIHDPEKMIGLFQDEEEGEMWGCDAPKPDITNPQEGQKEVTSGQWLTGQYCENEWYYYAGDKNNYEGGDWYSKKDYIDKVEFIIKCLGLINGDVAEPPNSFHLAGAETYVEMFLSSRIVSSSFFEVIKDDYPELCKDHETEISGTGKVETIHPELDLILELTAIGMAKDVIHFFRAKRLAKSSSKAIVSKGTKILDDKGNVLAELYEDGIRINNFIDEGGEVVGLSENTIRYVDESGNTVESTFQIIEKDGVVGFRKVVTETGEVLAKSGDELIDLIEITPKLKTQPNKAYFWSGRTNGVGGADKALEIAKIKGGTTLEGLIETKGIKMPIWDIDNPATLKAWEDVSAAYANQVSGEVRAVVGKELRPGNVWENIELPRLKSNKNVSKIITVDPETLVETVIFVR